MKAISPEARQAYIQAQEELAACSRVVGEAFFPVMVEALAQALSVRWVLLSKLDPTDPQKVQTVAAWDNGPVENFSYTLAHSPCENIVAEGTCQYADGITRLFPHDELLVEMGAESYVGAPLRSASGEVLGLLAVLDDKPMEHSQTASEIVEVLAGRAAAELERVSAASINERLGQIVENAVSEVYVFDAGTYKFVLVNRGARENLGYSMEELKQLTPWDLKPDFTAKEFTEMVEPLRNGSSPHFLFETKHRRKDGTLYDVAVQLQFIQGPENVYYASITDISERKRAEEARAHLAAIVASANEAIISKDLNGIVKSWNRGAEEIFGYAADEMIGTSIRRIIPDDQQHEEDDILDNIRRGRQVSKFDSVRLRRDGSPVHVSISISPIFDSTGKIVGASKIANDITDRKRAEERERLLMREVNHRAKNLLAVVQAIARQTGRGDPDTFVHRFGERIQALARSQDLLVTSGWQDVPIDSLVQSQLSHFRDVLAERIKISGPSLKITAETAQAIGLALHELATNAAKYGALSNDSGIVTISWEVVCDDAGDQRFVMTWSESGGPPVTKPSQRGFGSTVVDDMLKASVRGEIDFDFEPSGLKWRVECAAGAVLERDQIRSRQSGPSGARSARSPDQGGRVLVVEDEPLVAIEIAQTLRDAGFEVLGPTSSVAGAFELLKGDGCVAAVLDINLGTETAEPIAERLAEDMIPFLTVSSYSISQRPGAFENAPHLDKPLRPDMLITKLTDCLNVA